MQEQQAPAAIDVVGLTKRYGNRAAVDDVSFRVPSGSVSGLVGPNGAGKTTVMAMLLGLVRPTQGRASVLGHDVNDTASYLSRVGALIESPAFHPGLTGMENLRHLCRLGDNSFDGLPDLVDLVGLTGRERDRYATYSLGMKQRLGIAGALIGDPDLVVLDEPTNGVDPQGMRDIRGIVRTIGRQGRTVLVSSHLLGEVEAVCDHLVVLDRGGCRYAGPVSGIGAAASSVSVRSAVPPDQLAQVLRAASIPVIVDGDRLLVTAEGQEVAALAEQVNGTAHAAGIVLSELHTESSTLEDRVLGLVGSGSRS